MKIRTHGKQEIGRNLVSLALRGFCRGCKNTSILIVFTTIFYTLSVTAAGQESRPVSDSRHTFGPFDDLTKVQQVIQILAGKSIPVEQREKMERESLGFIVVSPGLESLYKVNDQLRSLRSSNIKDIVYLQGGDYQNRVSMGVFNNRVSAIRRQANLARLGFDSEVIDRSRSRISWWLDIDSPIEEDVLAEIREVAGDQIKMIVNLEMVVDQTEPAVVTEAEQVYAETTEVKSDEVVESATLESAEEVVRQLPVFTPVLATPEEQERSVPITSVTTPDKSAVSDRSSYSIFYGFGAFLTIIGVFGFMLYRMKMLRQRIMPPPMKALIGSALDSRDEGVLILDSDQTIVFANQSMKNIVKLSGEELLGKKTFILRSADADGTPISDAEAPWSQALIEGVPQVNLRLRLKSAGNRFGVFMTNSSPLLDDSGKRVGVLVSFNHLEELEVKNQSLQHPGPTQGDVPASHADLLAQLNPDIQGSMNAILGYAEVLRRGFGIESEASRKCIDAISSSSDRAVELINDIIELSKIETGNTDVAVASFSPRFVIDDVVNLMNIKVKDQGILVSSQVEGELPPRIISDPGKIRRILTNLVSNAVECSGKDDIIVVPGIIESESSAILTLTVHGAGSSLPEKEVENLLEFIAREINTGQVQGEGAGLGLSISKRIAKVMGGDIVVRREPGRGVIFEATIEVLVDEDQQNEEALAHQADVKIFAEKIANAEAQARKEGIARVEAEDQTKAAVEARTQAEAQLNTEVREKQAMQDRVKAEIAARTEIEARNKVEVDARIKAEERANAETEASAEKEARIRAEAEKRLDEETSRRTKAESRVDEETRRRVEAERKAEEEARAGAEAVASAEEEVQARTAADSSESTQERKTELKSEPVTPTVDISQGQGTGLRSRDVKVYQGTGPVRSSLNVSNPTIQKLVQKSVSRLESQLANMDLAFGTDNYSALTKLCYRFRGEADSVKLHPLIQPAKDLEEMVKSHQFARAKERLADLKHLVGRIDLGTDIGMTGTEYQNAGIPAEQAGLQDHVDGATASEKPASGAFARGSTEQPATEPIRSQLNLDNPKIHTQVEQFIIRLGSLLTELHHAWENKDFAAISRLSQWLVRYSRVLGFGDFTQPAQELYDMAAIEAHHLIPDKLDELRLLFARIED